jgi:carbon starvation protein CstA
MTIIVLCRLLLSAAVHRPDLGHADGGAGSNDTACSTITQVASAPAALLRFPAGYSFLLPFTWQTWLMFLIAMLVVVLLLTGMDIATRKARYAALEKVDSRKVQRSRKRGGALCTLLRC